MTMYLSFYGLAARPFSLTPDPKFLYLTPGHREALAQLTYGVENDQGLVVLTGAIGTGKTTLLNALRNELDGNAAVAYVSNTKLPFEALLEYMLWEFGISTVEATQVQRLIALNRFLVERDRAGQKTVLIMDEAQNLSPATLEDVRLLSNFETQGAKLLQILLVGQPELDTKLALPELRQLQQRIALRFHIERLSAEETGDYIRTRLRIAGAVDRGIFTDRAISRITRYAGGIPRVINILCDHCLLIGYAEQKRRIEPDIVEEARAHLDHASRHRSLGTEGRWSKAAVLPWAAGTLAAAAIVTGLAVLGLRPEAIELADLARSARDLLIR